MQRVTTQSITISAAVANAVCLEQTPSEAGAMLVNGANTSGGVYTAPTNPRHLNIVTAADEHLVTFTITGTDRNGNPMVYSTVGASSATTTVYNVNFQTITAVSVNAATAGAITIGFAAQGATGWIPLDRHSSPTIGIGVELSTSANMTFTMQSTYDDVQVKGFQEWDAYPIASAVVTGTASAAHTITHVARAIRFVVNPWVAGTATFTVIEKAP